MPWPLRKNLDSSRQPSAHYDEQALQAAILQSITVAVKGVLENMPPGTPVVVINNLTINYCSGGGATLQVRNG